MKHQMTVGKLIERLSNYDRDTLVMVRGEDHSYRLAYATDGLAEQDGGYYGGYYGEARLGDEGAFTVVVIE